MKIQIEINSQRFNLKEERHPKHYKFIMKRLEEWQNTPLDYIECWIKTDEEKEEMYGPDFDVYLSNPNGEDKIIWVKNYTKMDEYMDSLSEEEKTNAMNFFMDEFQKMSKDRSYLKYD